MCLSDIRIPCTQHKIRRVEVTGNIPAEFARILQDRLHRRFFEWACGQLQPRGFYNLLQNPDTQTVFHVLGQMNVTSTYASAITQDKIFADNHRQSHHELQNEHHDYIGRTSGAYCCPVDHLGRSRV